MFNKTRKEREEYIINWLGRLESELDRLVEVVESMDAKQKTMSNRVVAMDYALEIHEMDFEYFKANMKMRKKGNK